MQMIRIFRQTVADSGDIAGLADASDGHVPKVNQKGPAGIAGIYHSITAAPHVNPAPNTISKTRSPR